MISLVIPAYNEEEVIKKLIDSLEKGVSLDLPWEILAVDDGSDDNTGKILDALARQYQNLTVIHHKVNQNLGAALQSGIKSTRGDIIITIDADMTHPPELMAEMLKALRHSDVCVASRFIRGGGMLNVPLHRVIISRLANILYQILFLSPVKDNTSGYKAYRAAFLRSIEIEEKGFAVQLEIVTKLLRKKARFTEIPFVLANRELGTSKLRYLKAIPHYISRVIRLLFIRWV